MLKKIFKNTFFRQVSILVNITSKVLILAIIGRIFGPDAFGAFSLVFVIFNLLSVFSGLGFKGYLFYLYSKDRNIEFDKKINNFISTIFIFDLILITVTVLILHLSGTQKDLILFSFILNLGLIFMTLSEIFFHILDSQEEMGKSSLVRMALNSSSLILIFFGVFILRLDFTYVFISFMISYLIVFILTVHVFQKTFTIKFRMTLKPDIKSSLQTLKETYPFVLDGLFGLGLQRVDILILSIVTNRLAIGIYSSSLSLLVRLNGIIKPFTKAVFPRLNFCYKNAPEEFRTLFKNSLRLILFTASFCFVIFYLGADRIILFIWGAAFAKSIPILRILSFMIISRFINPFLSDLVTISGNQIKRAKLTFYTFILNLVLNLYLIPRFSYTGAAYSAVVTQAFLTLGIIILLFHIKIKVRVEVFQILKLAVICGILIFFDRLLQPLPLLPYFLSLSISFSLLCFLLGVVRKDDLKKIKSILSEKRPAPEQWETADL